MKLFVTLAMMLLTPGCAKFPVSVLSGPSTSGGGGGSCTLAAPRTHDWQMWNATCTISGTCSSTGQNIATVPDATGGNTLTTPAEPPFWTTAAYGSKGAAAFSTGEYLSATTDITPATAISWFGTFTQNGSGIRVLLGASAGTSSFEVRVNSSDHLEILNAGVTVLATSTSAISGATSYAVLYNSSTGAYAFYKMSGGTATADGSGTAATSSWSNPINLVGESGGDPTFTGTVLEEIYYAGTWDSTALGQLATFSQCNAGI